MTDAEVCRYAADWLDTLDAFARVALPLVEADPSTLTKAMEAVSGTEVQDDLRALAERLEAAAERAETDDD